jgi:DNA modification methylase
LVVTDPPYNVRIPGNVSGLGRIRHENFAMGSGEMNSPEFTAFLEVIFERISANAADGAIIDVFMDWRHAPEIFSAGTRIFGKPRNVCVWVKKNAGMGTFYRSQHEFVFIFKNGSAPHINNFELGQHGRPRSNVWNYAGVNTFKAARRDELEFHPTVKPVALVADAIKDCSRRPDIVLDPFVGSGTAIIAAERTGRCAYAMEIDPHYCDVAIRRWQTFTGKTAILASTRESFEEREEQMQTSPQPPTRRAAR